MAEVEKSKFSKNFRGNFELLTRFRTLQITCIINNLILPYVLAIFYSFSESLSANCFPLTQLRVDISSAMLEQFLYPALIHMSLTDITEEDIENWVSLRIPNLAQERK